MKKRKVILRIPDENLKRIDVAWTGPIPENGDIIRMLGFSVARVTHKEWVFLGPELIIIHTEPR